MNSAFTYLPADSDCRYTLEVLICILVRIHEKLLKNSAKYVSSPVSLWLIFGFFQCMNRIFHNLIHRFWFEIWEFPKIKVPSVERFSENFDQKVVTYLIFFVRTHWFQKIKYRFSYDALGCVSSRSSYITPKTLNFFKDGFIALFTNGNADIFAIFALHFSLDLALLQTKKKIGRKR